MHNPFGGYERDKVLYSKSEFMKHFREAFPEYSDIADSALYAKLLKKYPNFKTWIIEEADKTDPKPISITNLPTNYRLIPPPAYYGKKAILRSRNAFFTWLDEPIEFIGFLFLFVVIGIILFLLYRNKTEITG
ncbi:MAG: hypothetical protein ACTSPW_11105 [Promethearchaeota archaeon]